MPPDTNALLTQFLASSQRPKGTLTYHEVQGFLFAVACSPELIMPSEWMPLIFNEQQADYADMEQAQSVTQALMTLYNTINEQVFTGAVVMPEDIQLKTPALENVGDETALGQWSNGFLLGHNWLIELWNQYTPAALDEELGSDLMILSLFCSYKLAQGYHRELAGASDPLATFVEKMLAMFEAAMASYARLARSIQTVLAQQPEQPRTPYVADNKVGRNDPCPCGSGKKYKHCCLQ